MVDVDALREAIGRRRETAQQAGEDRANRELAKFGFRLAPTAARFTTCDRCGAAVPYLAVALETHYWRVHRPVKYRTAKAVLKIGAFMSRAAKNAESRRRTREKGRRP